MNPFRKVLELCEKAEQPVISVTPEDDRESQLYLQGQYDFAQSILKLLNKAKAQVESQGGAF